MRVCDNKYNVVFNAATVAYISSLFSRFVVTLNSNQFIYFIFNVFAKVDLLY